MCFLVKGRFQFIYHCEDLDAMTRVDAKGVLTDEERIYWGTEPIVVDVEDELELMQSGSIPQEKSL